MSATGLLLLVSYLVFATISYVYSKYSSRSIKDNQFGAVLGLSRLFITLPVTIIYVFGFKHRFDISGIMQVLPLIIISGIIVGSTQIYIFKLHKHLDVGNQILISNVWNVVVILILSVFLSQKLNFIQYLGFAMVMLSIIGVASVKSKGWFKFDSMALRAIIVYSIFGIGIAMEKIILQKINVETHIMLVWPVQIITIICLSIRQILADRKLLLRSKLLKIILISGALRSVQNLSFIMLFAYVVNGSIVSAAQTFTAPAYRTCRGNFLKRADKTWLKNSLLNSSVCWTYIIDSLNILVLGDFAVYRLRAKIMA